MPARPASPSSSIGIDMLSSSPDNPWGSWTPSVFSPDGLTKPFSQVVTDEVLLAAGHGLLPRGTVLGFVTSTGKGVPSVATATDGSEKPAAVLADWRDTTNADTKAPVIVFGELNACALNFDSRWTLTELGVAMRSAKLYVWVMPTA